MAQQTIPTKIVKCFACHGSGVLSQLDVDLFESCGECEGTGECEIECEICDCCRKPVDNDPAIGTDHYPTICGCEDDRCDDCGYCSRHCGCDENPFATEAAEEA